MKPAGIPHASRRGSCARRASRISGPRRTSTPHAGTGFRYAMNPHRAQALRRTPCSVIFRILPPQTMQ
jgi:hypothetical protein